MADLLSAALDYAAAGVYVFPARIAVVDGRKLVSPVARWREASSTTPEQIREWFAPGRPWSGASLCIDCGKSELVVIDLDVTGGRDGITAWGALLAEYPGIEPTRVRSHTPSGGEHWYYREARDRVVGIDSSGKVGPGIDVRGLGGFVIAWPSEDARGAYGTIDPAELAKVPVVPELVIERMARREAPAEGGLVDSAQVAGTSPPSVWDTMPRQFTRAEAIEFCRPTFAALRGAPDGSINHRLNTAAVMISHFVPAMWSRAKAVEILLDALSDTAYDGKTWKAQPTIDSGLGTDTWKAEILAQRPAQPVSAGNARTLSAVSADTLSMRAPQWLHERRIPLNAITLLAGREGIGKSTISYDVAAKVTLGTLPGQYAGTPRGVAVVAGEDSWEHVIVPRLVAAGADLRRVYRVEAVEDGRTDVVSVPADLARLGELCAERDVALIILDPLMSVISGSLDTHKDREVRQALDPLSSFAAKRNIAVLGLIHVNKTATTDPLTSIMASRAFAAVARSVLYCLLDPEAEGEDQYLFGHAKSNLGPRQETIKYGLIEAKVAESITTSRVDWRGVDTRSIRDAMETARAVARPVGELAVELEVWIREQGRTVETSEAYAQFKDHKPNTVRQNLKRMVGRGTIYSPTEGHYAIARSSSVTVTPPGESVSLSLGVTSDSSDASDAVTPPARDVTDPQCCEGGALLPKCQLCKASPNYWRESA